jgi:hypothetical protein
MAIMLIAAVTVAYPHIQTAQGAEDEGESGLAACPVLVESQAYGSRQCGVSPWGRARHNPRHEEWASK